MSPLIRVALEHLSSLEKKYHEQASKLQKEIANLQKNAEGYKLIFNMIVTILVYWFNFHNPCLTFLPMTVYIWVESITKWSKVSCLAKHCDSKAELQQD